MAESKSVEFFETEFVKAVKRVRCAFSGVGFSVDMLNT